MVVPVLVPPPIVPVVEPPMVDPVVPDDEPVPIDPPVLLPVDIEPSVLVPGIAVDIDPSVLVPIVEDVELVPDLPRVDLPRVVFVPVVAWPSVPDDIVDPAVDPEPVEPIDPPALEPVPPVVWAAANVGSIIAAAAIVIAIRIFSLLYVAGDERSFSKSVP